MYYLPLLSACAAKWATSTRESLGCSDRNEGTFGKCLNTIRSVWPFVYDADVAVCWTCSACTSLHRYYCHCWICRRLSGAVATCRCYALSSIKWWINSSQGHTNTAQYRRGECWISNALGRLALASFTLALRFGWFGWLVLVELLLICIFLLFNPNRNII